MRVNVVWVGRVTAGYIRFHRGMRLVTAPATHYHVNLPLSGVAESRSGRRESVQTTPGTAATFAPDLPADISWGEDCGQVCLMLPRADVESELESLIGRPLDKRLEFRPSIDLTTPAGRSWMRMLRLVDDESRRPGGLLAHPLAARHIEQVLLDGLLVGQPHNYTDLVAEPQPAISSRPVRRAVELLLEHPERPWSSAELADAVAVSVRSLQDGFRKLVGMSPTAYLREIRLDRAYRELVEAEPGTVTVTQVAARWGFVHLGRFAVTYRRKYAERPIDTLSGTATGLSVRHPDRRSGRPVTAADRRDGTPAPSARSAGSSTSYR